MYRRDVQARREHSFCLLGGKLARDPKRCQSYLVADSVHMTKGFMVIRSSTKLEVFNLKSRKLVGQIGAIDRTDAGAGNLYQGIGLLRRDRELGR